MGCLYWLPARAVAAASHVPFNAMLPQNIHTMVAVASHAMSPSSLP